MTIDIVTARRYAAKWVQDCSKFEFSADNPLSEVLWMARRRLKDEKDTLADVWAIARCLCRHSFSGIERVQQYVESMSGLQLIRISLGESLADMFVKNAELMVGTKPVRYLLACAFASWLWPLCVSQKVPFISPFWQSVAELRRLVPCIDYVHGDEKSNSIHISVETVAQNDPIDQDQACDIVRQDVRRLLPDLSNYVQDSVGCDSAKWRGLNLTIGIRTFPPNTARAAAGSNTHDQTHSYVVGSNMSEELGY
jgi:hypothetical protein